MVDRAYMKSGTISLAHSSDGLLTETTLPESGTSQVTPSSSAFGNGDIQAYTTVSHDYGMLHLRGNPRSFTNSLHQIAPYNTYSVPSYDSSALPTPVSLAGSPSIPEGTTAKPMPSYNQQRGRSSQQPTPPGTSQSEWPGQHIGMHSSQSGSPLPLQHPNHDVLGMHGIETTHSPPQDQNAPMVSEPNWEDWVTMVSHAPSPKTCTR